MKLNNLIWFGLGNFGLPIAQNCQDKGYKVTGCTFNNRGLAGAEKFAASGGTYIDASTLDGLEAYDALVLCLPRSSDVQKVLQHFENKLPKLIIDLTTGSPEYTTQEFLALQEKGILLIDAPVSGSDVAARNGALTLFVGAEQSNIPPVVIDLFNVIGISALSIIYQQVIFQIQ